MKNLLNLLLGCFATLQVCGQSLPECLVKTASRSAPRVMEIREALRGSDTVYVINSANWDTKDGRITRHEIMMINQRRKDPNYLWIEVYDQKCKRRYNLKNRDLKFTGKIFRDAKIKQQMQEIKS